MGSAGLQHGRYEAWIELVRELVEIESPSGDREASEQIANVLAPKFEALGGTARHVASELGTHLVIDFQAVQQPAESPLVFIGHTDTVWPRGTLSDRVPWSNDGETVRGPGAYDMKAGIVVMLAALERTQSSRPAVRVVLVCDEEIGSPTSGDLLREAVRDCSGAIGFESPHPSGDFKVGRRGSVRIELEVQGRAAHAALDPELGVSAIDELVDQLARVREFMAKPELSSVLCNVGTVAGGTRANVVPDSATAEIGLRFVDAETEATVLTWLEALAPFREGARVTATKLSHRPTWAPSAADARLLSRVQAAAGEVGQAIDGHPAAGAGDTNLAGSLRVPTLDGFGPAGGGAHAVDEHFSVRSFGERIELLTALLAAPPRNPAQSPPADWGAP